MRELLFSVCNEPADILAVLEPFNAKQAASAQVKLRFIPWDQQKKELTELAISGRAVGVAQVGGPVVSNLIAMGALKPFSKSEMGLLGGESAFSQVAWENSYRFLGGNLYAVPWVIDARAIFYWRDMLATANVNETGAFATFDGMEETFAHLRSSGVESPWALALNGGPLIQPACTWIWGMGGDIGEGKELTLMHPNAILGLQKFFGLYRYMPQQNQPLGFGFTYHELFAKRRIAVTMGSLSTFLEIKRQLPLGLRDHLGVALAPGPFFVGSSSLIIWKDSQEDDLALELVRYLVSGDAQKEYCDRAGYLPARLSVLNDSHYATDPYLRVFVESAQNGRNFSKLSLWGGFLEDHLSASVKRIWQKIIANPNINLDTVLLPELEAVIQKSNVK